MVGYPTVFNPVCPKVKLSGVLCLQYTLLRTQETVLRRGEEKLLEYECTSRNFKSTKRRASSSSA